ncbi:MAG TPA: SpoIIE family protein phosphatase [Candidatus Cybelea sp.]
MVRSLDRPDDRLNRVLEVLVQAGHALRLCPDIDEALAQIAGSLVEDFCRYCSIDVSTEAVERCDFRAEAGSFDPHAGGERTIVQPLNDGRRALGRITCQAPAGQEFDDVVRQAIRLLATQLAVVLGGQVLMMREHRVADRLQRALLPERLPTIDGAEFYAAYRPASAEAEVGGDWFDAFSLADQRVGISLGDVAGHGLEAAVIMGEVRQAIRAAAVAAASPASVLEHVNQIIALQDSVGMVTAIFGIYDPQTSTLVYAVAGHPPPLLALPRGFARRLPGGGLPLGCAPAVQSRDWTFTLAAGASAVFYTDGLIENERAPIAGEQRLLEVVRNLVRECGEPGSHVEDPAAALLERVFRGTPNRDDAAVLLLSRTAPVSTYLFSAVPIAAPIARAIVERDIEPLGVDGERRFDLLIALGEAVANAIEHGYRDAPPGLIRLRLEHNGRQLVMTIEDFGHWKPFARSDVRGRGIELMHACMDSVQIQSTRDSTKIVLKAALAS